MPNCYSCTKRAVCFRWLTVLEMMLKHGCESDDLTELARLVSRNCREFEEVQDG